MSNEYPPPKPFIDYNNEGGLKLIVPIALESYKHGYNRMVQDIYRLTMLSWVIDGQKHMSHSYRWGFWRRERSYSKPIHYSLITGKEIYCQECEDYYKQYPNKCKDLLIQVPISGLPLDYKVD